jgi:DNA repair protein RecO (recombination protein O)
MNWEDEGYLLSKRKFRENANIINIFTINQGKVSGIVFGGNSRKIRNYLQIGNKIFVVNNSKNENKIGYLKTELIEAISPKYFSDKKRTTAILSVSNILNSLLPDSQSNKTIYKSLENFYKNLELDNWIVLYIFWELNLIKELGFGLDLEKFNEKGLKDDEILRINLDNQDYEIPYFLITKKIPKSISSITIRKSLSFTRFIFQNKFFLPNSLIFPRTRVLLENYFI